MTSDQPTVTFDQKTEFDGDHPTLIEGLPGHGLVAAIATDLITRQLELEHHGNITSEDFPAVTTYVDGRVRDIVRVYAGESPPVMTLQSDLPLPQSAFPPLSRCILDDLSNEFDRAIFLAGAPASNEQEVGEVIGIATDDRIEDDLKAANINLATGHGLVGGITGALTHACFQADVPAAVLVVKSNPYLPDPGAAQSVIETALEPLVDFEIDTTELKEQADSIREHMEQIAKHYQHVAEVEGEQPDERHLSMMYQ